MFRVPLTPYSAFVRFTIFQKKDVRGAFDELRRRDLGYIFKDADALGESRKEMLASMPEEVTAWYNFYSPEGTPIPDMSVEGWCDKQGFLKFYQQRTLRRQVPMDDGFEGAWDLFGLKGMRAVVEAMHLGQFNVGMIQESLKGFATLVEVPVLDNYLAHFFDVSDMSKDEIWAWIGRLAEFSRENPSFTAEAQSKRVAITAPLDLFQILRRMGVTTKITAGEMLAEIRHEAFGSFKDASDRHERKFMPEEDFDRMDRGISMMKKCSDMVIGAIDSGVNMGIATDEMRKAVKQRIAFISDRKIRTRAELIADGEEIAERKKLPPNGEKNN